MREPIEWPIDRTDPFDDVVDRLRASGCVLAEEEARLLVEAAAADGDLRGRVEQRVAGRPLEHVLGWARFGDHRVDIVPGVFVPRHRSEAIVRSAVATLTPLVAGDPTPGSGHERPVLLDLCCGTGALGLAVASAACRHAGPTPFFSNREDRGTGEYPIEVHAADIDPVAVGCAGRNLAPIGGRAHVGDLFAAIPQRLAGRIDVVVANVPYVPTAAIELLPPEARDHEPRVALDGGVDGLDVLRRVAAEAGRWLRADGRVVFELAEDQVAEASDTVRAAGFGVEIIEDDDAGAIVLVGTSSAGLRS